MTRRCMRCAREYGKLTARSDSATDTIEEVSRYVTRWCAWRRRKFPIGGTVYRRFEQVSDAEVFAALKD